MNEVNKRMEINNQSHKDHDLFEKNPVGAFSTSDLEKSPDKPIFHVKFPYTHKTMKLTKPGRFIATY